MSKRNLLALNNAKVVKETKIQTEKNSLKSRLVYYQDQEDKLRQTIRDLQQEINNHTCPALPVYAYPFCFSDYQEIKGQK